MSKRVQVRLRQAKRPDKSKMKAELRRIDHQIENVVDTLATVGQSAALTARLKQLDADRETIAAPMAYATPNRLKIVPDVARRVRALVENLERLPENPYRDEALMDKARIAIRGLLGPVTIIEDREGVIAKVELGRACITDGSGGRICM